MSALPATVPTEADLEFDRQVDALALTGLPEHRDLADSCFRAWLEPLRDRLPDAAPDGDRLPFVVVVPDLPVVDVLSAVHTVDGPGFTTMDDDELAGVQPLPELDVPGAPYLLVDVDTGADSLGLAPADALPRIAGAGRSPLTLAEGLAVLVAEPGVLRSRNSFSLLGSRAGDTRVPALWVDDQRPRLGWWSAGTGLGPASCRVRLTA